MESRRVVGAREGPGEGPRGWDERGGREVGEIVSVCGGSFFLGPTVMTPAPFVPPIHPIRTPLGIGRSAAARVEPGHRLHWGRPCALTFYLLSSRH